MPTTHSDTTRKKYLGLNLSWLWLNHVPPEYPLSPAQRLQLKQLVKHFRKQSSFGRGPAGEMSRTVLLLTIPLALLFTLGVWMLASRQLPLPFQLTTSRYAVVLVACIALFEIALWMIIAYSFFRYNRPFVRLALNAMGKPVCIACGYVRRGLSPDQLCPECGAGVPPLPPPGL